MRFKLQLILSGKSNFLISKRKVAILLKFVLFAHCCGHSLKNCANDCAYQRVRICQIYQIQNQLPIKSIAQIRCSSCYAVAFLFVIICFFKSSGMFVQVVRGVSINLQLHSFSATFVICLYQS
jgi:hypothetical protein